ncbi:MULTISPECIES: hypothetical protein [Vitreoscilla]|uniref:Uncharacterized protein n=1 Tax=Vitreoscilla stercoraria TaxID=61 RepID=A0ABY4E7F4_VITST|nr:MULTISPECIES: hypothetical protein [Vitreoscilla]AUZ04599.1 hypothetical protein ADP71_08630 [Vitreoscilla sp. C1]UOO91703.1 hypothetical protein LVJ81_08640 [Vitreoscilla stercoraria]
MFTLFVLNLIILGVVCAGLMQMIKNTRAEIMALKKQVERLQARLDGITHSDTETL